MGHLSGCSNMSEEYLKSSRSYLISNPVGQIKTGVHFWIVLSWIFRRVTFSGLFDAWITIGPDITLLALLSTDIPFDLSLSSLDSS